MSEVDQPFKSYNLASSDGRSINEAAAQIIREVSLTIKLQGRPIATIACTGIHIEELVVGFLKSEKLICTRTDLAEIKIADQGYCANVTLRDGQEIPAATVKNIASSGASFKSIKSSVLTPLRAPDDFIIHPRVALELMDDLLANTVLHRQTHGTHCSALAKEGKIIVRREDIGRHNTIDMLGGYALLGQIDLSAAILLTTGRISSEIVGKVRNLGIAMIISHSAPTTKALDLADEAGITLIGYMRGSSMNIYSHERRVSI